MDLKSTAVKGVPVQVRSAAPTVNTLIIWVAKILIKLFITHKYTYERKLKLVVWLVSQVAKTSLFNGGFVGSIPTWVTTGASCVCINTLGGAAERYGESLIDFPRWRR